jgi:cytoskeletal protein CcmA (bactofilin family)
VTGNVTATERLDVQATASVHGDIRSPRLVVADGATLNGKVDAGLS